MEVVQLGDNTASHVDGGVPVQLTALDSGVTEAASPRSSSGTS